MNDQEMQFADPDWQPTRPLDKSKASQEQEVDTPQPINSASQAQQQWQTPPPLHDYQDGYSGSDPQVPPAQKLEYPRTSPYNYTAPNNVTGIPYRQQTRRRGRSPWLWVIIAIIIFGFMSGGFGSAFRGFGFQNSVTEAKTFIVRNQPTIIIKDLSGNIQVHTGDTRSVNVQAVKQADGFGNPKNEQVSYNQSGDTITIDFENRGGSVDFNVTVPSTSNLQLQTNSDSIDVEGVTGQISMSSDSGDITATNDTFSGSTSLTTGSGDINAKQDQLTGPTTLKTDSGDITFDGTITGNGNSQFTTGSGGIDATLSGSPAVTVNASTDSGSIDSNAPTVNVQNNDSGGTASGYIGSSNASTQLTLKTGSGDIHINTQP